MAYYGVQADSVTPFVGVWIEIPICGAGSAELKVTPFVGVWIEIRETCLFEKKKGSLPSWECGLKYHIYIR